MTGERLLELARQAQQRAYAPYSGCRVGAALLCADGTVFLGCNIENAAYGPTICAERTAIFKAVSEGKREFSAIAVWGGEKGEPFPPCGVCRQVMAEFCGRDFPVYLAGGVVLTLGELLPHGFGAENFREEAGKMRK